MMQWEKLLSLRRKGDINKRLRIEQDETRLGFEVDYDRIIFSSAFRSLQDKTQVIPLSKTSFVMDQSIYKDDLLIVDAKIHLVFVNTNGKPTKIPEIVLNSFDPYILKFK